MPIFDPKKVEKLPYKIYKAVSKHVHSKKKRKQKSTEQLAVPIRSKTLRRFDETYETYVRILVNNLTLTRNDGKDGAFLNRETHYGMFINSPGIRRNKSIVVSESTDDSVQRAVINIGPMPGQLKRSKSYDTMLNDEKLISREPQEKDIQKKVSKGDSTSKKYSKYIPVSDSMGDVYSRTSFDSNAPLSWLDLQAWYSDYLEDVGDGQQIHPSNSESTLAGLAPENIDKIDNTKRGKYLNQNEVVTDMRFGEINQLYLSHAAVNHLETVFTSIEVKIQMEDKYRFGFCEMKANMISKCLYSFFYPYGENSVSCVSSVQFDVEKLITSGNKDMFGRKLEPGKVRAFICLDSEPAALIRHKDLCMFDTICFIMGIQFDELMLFQRSD